MNDKNDFYYAHIPIVELIDEKIQSFEKDKNIFQTSKMISFLKQLRKEIKEIKKLISKDCCHI